MCWKIEFYDVRVMKNIKSWPVSIRAKFTHIADLIEELGPAEVGMPHVKALRKGLFEIRAKGNDGIGRAFFCSIKGKIVIILSGFIKKSKKTPQREILLARKLMKKVKNDEEKTRF